MLVVRPEHFQHVFNVRQTRHAIVIYRVALARLSAAARAQRCRRALRSAAHSRPLRARLAVRQKFTDDSQQRVVGAGQRRRFRAQPEANSPLKEINGVYR